MKLANAIPVTNPLDIDVIIAYSKGNVKKRQSMITAVIFEFLIYVIMLNRKTGNSVSAVVVIGKAL